MNDDSIGVRLIINDATYIDTSAEGWKKIPKMIGDYTKDYVNVFTVTSDRCCVLIKY